MTIATWGHATLAPEPPEPPVVTPGDVPTVVYELRRDGTLLGVFNQVGSRDRRRGVDGPGELTVACSLVPAIDPVVEDLYVDGEFQTWRDDRLEVWVKRRGVLVWQGPVVAGEEDWDAAEVLVRCHSREGYFYRLINGMDGTTELLPEGHFDEDLSGWTAFKDTGAEASAAFPYRDPLTMAVAGVPGSFMRAVLELTEPSAGNDIHITIPVRVEGPGSFPVYGDVQVVARITRFLDGVEVGEATIVLPADIDLTGYPRASTVIRQLPGGVNMLWIDVLTGITEGSIGRIGEVTVVRYDNVSSRAGWDIGTFAAATFDEAVEDLNEWSGPDWDRFVEPAGETFYAAKREPKVDHGDYVSFLRDLEPWGDWRVPLGTHTAQWGDFAVDHGDDFLLTPEMLSGMRVVRDGTEASTVVVVYANGPDQEGPTREEGRAEADGIPGAVLHDVIEAPPGSDVRDLERLGEEHLASPDARTRTQVEGDPVRGPVTVALPGEWQHHIGPGDTLPLEGECGVSTIETRVRVERVIVEDLDDSVRFEVTVL